MASGIALRLGTRADDGEIRALLRRNPMPGSISFAFTHEPSFFDAIEVEGHGARVIVGEVGGLAKGVGLMACRQVYLNGHPQEIGYLSSLRIDSDMRGSSGLARGYRFLRRLHEQDPGAPFYLTTIMEDNIPARTLLTSGRAGLPQYHEIGTYLTMCIPLLPVRARRGGIQVAPATRMGLGAAQIAGLLERWGPSRQLYPVYTQQDIESSTGILRGLSVGDFFVAVDSGQPCGVAALWDQMSFRQNVVTGYSLALRLARPLANAVGGALGLTLLPTPGAPVEGLMVACLATRDDDPDVTHALLIRLIEEGRGRRKSYMFVGLAEHDPRAPAAAAFRQITLRSRVYLVTWDGPAPTLDERPFYLEAGSL